MSDPAIKTPQFEHQSEIYIEHREDYYHALFLEMGLGKSKIMLDVASHLYVSNKINLLIVLAPNSVYKNWISQEVPQHLAVAYAGMAYPKLNSQYAQMKRLIFMDPSEHPNRLKFLCMSYDSMKTEHGFEFLKKLMIIYRTMIVADESTALKSHSSDCAKKAKKLAKLAKYRWIATGTPVANSPFDIHSQVEFLSEDFWAELGLKSFSAFKNEFGIFHQRRVANRTFAELTSYRRIDTLQKIIKPISSRLLKEDSTVKLPPKTYSKRIFELTEAQRILYDQVKHDFEAEISDGLMLSAPLAIVRLARLQQIASGFVTAAEFIDDELELFPSQERGAEPDHDWSIKVIESRKKIVDIVPKEENPRLKALMATVDECCHKVIVWCRFRRDVDLICNTLGDRCVRFDGATSQKDRAEALTRFRDPVDPAQVFVANIHAISQGVTLTIAKTMIYYTNSFSLEKRLQSEDRFHRIGQDSPVLIVDIAAEDTVDERIINCLREKYDIAALVTGDRIREWIS